MAKLPPLAAEEQTSRMSSTSHSSSDAPATNVPKVKKINSKKEMVEAVRKLAPVYSVALPLTRLQIRNPKGDANDESGSSLFAQLKVVESGVNITVRRYNELKLEADRKAKELRETLDVMCSIKIDNDALLEMKKKENYESMRITELQELIEKVQKQIDDKIHHRRQLELMARRLDTNQVAYDAHLNSMETAMVALLKEYHQIEDLQLALENGKVVALNDLEELEMQLLVEKQLRGKIQCWRKSEYRNAAGMEEWRHDRDHMQKELVAELRGELNQQQMRRLEKKILKAETRNRELCAQAEQANKQMSEMEEVFRQLQQVTGVNSFEEMVQKFSAQRTNTQALQEEKRQAEERLTAAKVARDETEQAFSKMRAQGIGCTEVNREVLNGVNAQVLKERMEMKVNRAMNERLNAVLVHISQGASGLSRRLHPFTHLAEFDNALLNPTGTGLMANDSPTNISSSRQRAKAQEQLMTETLQALLITEAIAVKMTDIISERESQRFGSSTGSLDDERSLGSDSTGSEDLSLDGFTSVNRNNLRVRSQLRRKDMERQEATRELGESGQQTEKVVNPIDEIAIIEELVPSRKLVKLSSERQYSEAMRRAGQALKKQRYLERLAAADEKEKGLLQSLAAKRKAQRDHASKLCATPTLGLPKGLTRRDDALTQADVFLNAMPELT